MWNIVAEKATEGDCSKFSHIVSHFLKSILQIDNEALHNHHIKISEPHLNFLWVVAPFCVMEKKLVKIWEKKC